AAAFLHRVFSLHDPGEVRELLGAAGFSEIGIQRATKALRVAPPEQFVWQYVYSTPMAGALSELDSQRRAALERDVCAQWRVHCHDGALMLDVAMTTAIATK